MSKYASLPTPAADGDRFSVKDAVGHLLVLHPIEKREMDTAMGPGTAMVTDVIDVTEGKEYPDQLIFQSVIVSTLSRIIGQTVLVRLQQGVAKPGKTAPYILADASGNPEDVAAAEAYEGGSAPSADITEDQALDNLNALLS